MKDLNQLTVTEFLQELASENPVPGGGSTAALAGALAAALTAMVARLTVGKEKFKDRWETLEAIEKRAAQEIPRFQSLVQRDTEAYQAVVDAFRRPKETEEEKRARSAAIQEAFKEAARVPLETLLALERLVGDALEAVRSGNPNASSDAGAAVQMIQAGATVAAYNVWINLGSIKDEAFGAAAREKTDAALATIRDAAARCHDLLAKELL
ncbi:Formiminotetrahydrofolate cyclodeaminase [Desulfacinum hydrothermale DSM 13146]|uniref:Formiminotetrahydrofolate cyclodeaminase n=1 Tax=Desulfacinum hydrothermale DSM 13146 TaxID=1121390 RepID=A0A1W1XMG6_9BACT|nr:cyclodeaminase/cyclohydrolase family protein [Desulfacinum hydrothermale]SMC25035.1 Formiminotetrahydrofolate cyclodeaminase [Desulfacinum hydrothermale DSM 13146]